MADYTPFSYDYEVEIEKSPKTKKLFVGEYAIEDYARVEFDIDFIIDSSGDLTYEIENAWVNGTPATDAQIKTVLAWVDGDKGEKERLQEAAIQKAEMEGEHVYGPSDWAKEHSTYY